MSDPSKPCRTDYEAEKSALRAEVRRLKAEITAVKEAGNAELRVLLDQRMEAGDDISHILDALEREGCDIGEFLFG